MPIQPRPPRERLNGRLFPLQERARSAEPMSAMVSARNLRTSPRSAVASGGRSKGGKAKCGPVTGGSPAHTVRPSHTRQIDVSGQMWRAVPMRSEGSQRVCIRHPRRRGHAPSAAERLVEADAGLQARELYLNKAVLGGEESLLRLQDGEKI